jgi:hypothetical protein
MSSSFTQPFITHCLSKDSSIFIRWTYDLTSTNYTYETYIDIHNKTTDVLSRIYIPNINDLSFKIPNLINDNEYLLKITQVLDTGDELYSSNTVKSTPRSKPLSTVAIETVVVNETPDAQWSTSINYRLWNMAYDDAKIKHVSFKIIKEFDDVIKTVIVSESSLLKNNEGQFLENQTLIINDLNDGDYFASASITNNYGTSLLSPSKSFTINDMPNDVTNVEVFSGLDNSVQLKFSCIESIMTGFNVTHFVVRYFKSDEPNIVMQKNVQINDCVIVEGVTINGDVIIDNLVNVQEYIFSVVSVNKRGESVPSPLVSGWAGLPDEITALEVTYVTNTTLDASWTLEAKSYRLKTLTYAVMKNNDVIKTGNLGINDVSLSLSGLNLPDGQRFSLKLIPYYNVPSGFVPHTGEIKLDGLYSSMNEKESQGRLVFAKCNILFATSGINTKEVKLVAQVHSLEVTAMEFQTKLKTDPESPWVVVGTIMRSNLVVSGSILTGSITLANVEFGQYDVQARAIYNTKFGPLTGVKGKVTSLDLPKILGVDVVILSQETLELQVSYDDDNAYPDDIVLGLYNNPEASGVALKTVTLAGAGAAVAGNNYARKYTTDLSNIVPDTLVYFNVLVKRLVDTSYYVSGDNGAPNAVEGRITYNSFVVANSYYITSQGEVSAQSGASTEIDVVIKFPFNSDKWNRVKEVVLQRSSDNIAWENLNTFAFVAETADTDSNGNVVISELDNNVVNGTQYTYRAFNVPKSVSDVVYPVFDVSKYASALPFLAIEVSSVSVSADIDENDNKLKINTIWNNTPGTYTTYFDVFVYSSGTLIVSKNRQSGTTTTFALDTNTVCAILDLVPTDIKNAAELLFNKNITIEVVPYVQVPNSDNLVFISKFIKEGNYLTYSGATSSPVEAVSTPNPVTSVTLLSLSSNSATFSFVKPIVTLNKPLTKYVLELSLSVTFSSVTPYDITPDSNTYSYQQYSVSDLSANTTYYYRIRTANLLGYSRFLNGGNFHTSEILPSVSPVSVSQNVNDSMPKCDITFIKINSSTYTVQAYLLSVFNSLTNSKIGDDIPLASNILLPYIYTGEFGKSYNFKVVAKMTNSLNEPIYSLEDESQSITLCDKPIFHNDPVWSTVVNSINSQVDIVIDPNGSDSVTIILMALPSNSNSNENLVFTPPTPTVGNDGLFYYNIKLPYQVNTPPKFIAVVSNIKGSNYVMGGF